MKKIWPSGYCWLRTQNLELLISVLQLSSYSQVRPVCISVPSPTLKIWGMRMLPFLTSKNLLRRYGQGDLLGIHRHAFWFKQASLLSPQSNYCICLDRASECAWDCVPALKSTLCLHPRYASVDRYEWEKSILTAHPLFSHLNEEMGIWKSQIDQ